MEKEYIIRNEVKEDNRVVENLIRESFWNVYRPGCLEHYVIHVLREDTNFISELDFVMEIDGEIVGQNIGVKAYLTLDDGRKYPVITMGPLCIKNSLKRKSYGKILMEYSLNRARELGYGAIFFEGNYDFYSKCGVRYAKEYGIKYHDLKPGDDDSFFLGLELVPGYLDGIAGTYETPKGYYVDEKMALEFDKEFPYKEKLKLPTQIFG